MKQRKLSQYYVSTPMQDGAGVKLRRLFWREDSLNIDPFLMLDTFDSTNPEDYIKGFPFHPHRGIQTFTYLISGEIVHKDSMNNVGTIKSGEYQWMSAGSGVFHEEMPQAVEHMKGFQLWINLPASEKMSTPLYVDGNASNIPVVKKDGYTVNILSGEFDGISKTDLPSKFPIEVYDIEIDPNKDISIPIKKDYKVFVSTFLGNVTICDKDMEEKSGATFIDGDMITIKTHDKPVRLFLFAGKALNEPIAWRGPIVMNTKEELALAFKELEEGSFVTKELKSI